MRVRMKVQVSGMRNGAPWPPAGTVMDLPDEEAHQYCEAGMAVPASERAADVKTTTLPADEEKRGTTALTTKTGPAPKRRR